MKYKIHNELEQIEDNYEKGTITIVDGLQFSHAETIKLCEFYSNSRYLDGQKDEKGRIKPFYNIVNYRVTLAKVATDIDIKDIQISSDDPKHAVESMLLNKEAYKWMKAENFSLTLNKMGYKRPKYGGVLVKKFLDKKGLHIDVVDWRNVYVDPVDIMGNPIVECHYMTPVELKAKAGVWEDIDDALEAIAKKGKKENNGEYTNRMEVYEIHGQFTKSCIADFKGEDYSAEDDFEYSNQVYFVGKIAGKFFNFFGEEEDESPYMYLPWEEMEGRSLGRGVIEDSTEAQVGTNDAVINEKNAMDLAGRVVGKTNAKKLSNNLMEVDNGKIFELGPGEDINILNLTPTSLGEYQAQIDRWNIQADRSVSSFDANTGEQPPANTPYSQTALLNQVASKPFDYRREEMGIFLTEMFNKWVIPYLVKSLYKKHILVSDYSDEELSVIDKRFTENLIKKQAIKNLIDTPITVEEMMNGSIDGLTTPEVKAGMEAQLKSQLMELKGKRYIKIPEGQFDDIVANTTVITTGEQRNKAATLQSLSTILQTVQASFNPNTGTFGVLENPTLNRIFGTIIELSGAGISPVALGLAGNIKQGSAVQLPAQEPVNASA